MMRWLTERIRAYPVRFQGVVNAGLALAVGFGLNIDDYQMGLLLAFSSSVLALLAERSVTPISKLPEYGPPSPTGHARPPAPPTTVVIPDDDQDGFDPSPSAAGDLGDVDPFLRRSEP